VTAALFVDWAISHIDKFKELTKQTTRHGILIDVKPTLNSNTAFLIFEFRTADASGQNMVTVATEKICRWIEKETPYKANVWYIEGNLSGDKKATMLSFISHRGRKVVAEAVLSEPDIKRFLHTTPEAMAEYCRVSTLGGVQSGSIGVQGHFANALAALFLCCGQDVACLSEASVGITTMQVNDDGNLYVSVSLPNLTVGTVGGGTFMPNAKDCLRMLGCEGSGHARKFAEICAATVLAGEVSIIAALACGDFAKAHTTFRHKSE
jgi:hydroxymethylglutaryl-CoA reductase (NADPH)